MASRHLLPLINIPKGSKVYAFGAQANSQTPLISWIHWLARCNEAWAVVSGTGGGGKSAIFKTLLGHTRIVAPTPEIQHHWVASGGLYPFYLKSADDDPYTRIAHVSFRQRSGGASGAFFDYTARYGATWEAEEKVTLRDTLMPSVLVHPRPEDRLRPQPKELFERLVEQMRLEELLDLPMLALSNGQTRRARIAKAILDYPELLLLDEPLTGLDVISRHALDNALQQTHQERSPRIILGLRKGDHIPPWITNVLEIDDKGIAVMMKAVNHPNFKPLPKEKRITESPSTAVGDGDLVVDMRNINVAYGPRKILSDINWQIRQGERWHLQGSNGSGKTTLLAMLTGDHPQSYTQAHLMLPALSSSPTTASTTWELRHRKRTPTAHLRTVIGVVSPELADAFPRRHPGMSVWEAVTTGFDGGFVPRTRDAPRSAGPAGLGWVDVADAELSPGADDSNAENIEVKRAETRSWRVERCWEVLRALGPASWTRSKSPEPSPADEDKTTREFAARSFSSLSTGEQRLVLLMRALVGRPPVVLLDEVWSGMDGSMIEAARQYLRGNGVDEKQAVVVITHWVDEVPWTGAEVKVLALP